MSNYLHPELSALILDAYFQILRAHANTRLRLSEEELTNLLIAELETRHVHLHRDLQVQYTGLFGLSGLGSIDLLANDKLVIEIEHVPAINEIQKKQLAAQLLAGNYALGVVLNFGAPGYDFAWQRHPY